MIRHVVGLDDSFADGVQYKGEIGKGVRAESWKKLMFIAY